ncbi:hypothetical protein WDM22_34375 [Bradyrhizobium septentrionale]|uniref:Uncharacterized protein n=1 Tax=Bradyrhizobium septentrionale TaxID=1404411 RepID=A0A973ZZS1_9BRAD|nr:hypothetical protein [Bradyrhizobium septentrionale]UGY20364.1 hypothetical protein HAP48_0024915 [Bradyrhizobium septentrionale]UGY29183.1 hypothetical protein HU675_0022115 [Bradyrhizobium septentrionale]
MSIPMPPIEVTREQENAVSSLAPRAKFKSGLKVEFGVIELRFSNNNGSLFTTTLEPHHFRRLLKP